MLYRQFGRNQFTVFRPALHRTITAQPAAPTQSFEHLSAPFASIIHQHHIISSSTNGLSQYTITTQEINQGFTMTPPSFLPSFSKSSKPYFSLPQAEDGEPLQPQPEKGQQQQRQRSIWPSKVLTFWIFMSLFFACTTTWLTAELHAVRKQGSFARGFRNELGEVFFFFLSRVLAPGRFDLKATAVGHRPSATGYRSFMFRNKR